MLLQKTKDYVNDELLPDEANRYSNPEDTAKEVIEAIGIVNRTLVKPTEVAKNILENRKEFIKYVVKAFQNVEEK